MKKLVSILLFAVFTLSFVAGMMVSKAEAAGPCIATCIVSEGLFWVCCPIYQGGQIIDWDCFWDYSSTCGPA